MKIQNRSLGLCLSLSVLASLGFGGTEARAEDPAVSDLAVLQAALGLASGTINASVPFKEEVIYAGTHNGKGCTLSIENYYGQSFGSGGSAGNWFSISLGSDGANGTSDGIIATPSNSNTSVESFSANGTSPENISLKSKFPAQGAFGASSGTFELSMQLSKPTAIDTITVKSGILDLVSSTCDNMTKLETTGTWSCKFTDPALVGISTQVILSITDQPDQGPAALAVSIADWSGKEIRPSGAIRTIYKISSTTIDQNLVTAAGLDASKADHMACYTPIDYMSPDGDDHFGFSQVCVVFDKNGNYLGKAGGTGGSLYMSCL
jgi:hypothetical protein